jgi:uncharacterized membrane-anchored protein YhcB (DUF1043 family)
MATLHRAVTGRRRAFARGYSRAGFKVILRRIAFARLEGSPVYDLTIVIATGAGMLILGLLLGALLGRRIAPAVQRYREVERRLDQLLQDKKAYEDEVVEHFADTARLLNNLNQSYREVHNHLAKGAANLCHGQGPVALERLGGIRDESEIPPLLADARPPLDYAVKTSPNEKGMLNEEFGLERKQQPAAPTRPLEQT